MNTRLTQEKIDTTIAEIRARIKEDHKCYQILNKYAMSAEQGEAWTCLVDGITKGEYRSITVPLSDIWRKELPGTEDTTVKLTWFDYGDTADYYMALNHNGTLYDTEFEDVSFRMPIGFSLTEINGLPVAYMIENITLHSELVRLMTRAGILENELNK